MGKVLKLRCCFTLSRANYCFHLQVQIITQAYTLHSYPNDCARAHRLDAIALPCCSSPERHLRVRGWVIGLFGPG
eukprot:scaffold889_cov21-Tisochrysis_lutea.AAC.7